VLALPASAPAATKPTVATGGTTRLASTTVRLWGTVDPNGAKTTYLFQYGTTNLYGTSTPITVAGNAGRPVQLQASPFPHVAGFVNVGNPQVASAQGVFAFTLLSVGINTQFRVVLPSKPQVFSPVVGVGVAPRVATRVSARTVFTGARVRFSGTVRPARRGARVVIQRKRGKRWRYVAATKSRRGGQRFSRYAPRIRIRRGGSYRVLVESADGSYINSTGRTIKIRRR